MHGIMKLIKGSAFQYVYTCRILQRIIVVYLLPLLSAISFTVQFFFSGIEGWIISWTLSPWDIPCSCLFFDFIWERSESSVTWLAFCVPFTKGQLLWRYLAVFWIIMQFGNVQNVFELSNDCRCLCQYWLEWQSFKCLHHTGVSFSPLCEILKWLQGKGTGIPLPDII